MTEENNEMQKESRRLNSLAINNEGFVFDPSTGESYTANSTGVATLRGLEEGKSVKETATLLVDEFEVSQEEAEADVTDFIQHLRTYHLL